MRNRAGYNGRRNAEPKAKLDKCCREKVSSDTYGFNSKRIKGAIVKESPRGGLSSEPSEPRRSAASPKVSRRMWRF
jgi:hypothetical protein